MIRVGMDLSGGHIKAVVLGKNGLAWSHESSIQTGEGPATLERVLAEIRQLGRGRLDLIVAVGADRSQLKRIEDLPADTEPALLQAAIARNAGRFFLQADEGLEITSPWRDEDAGCWVGAVHTSVAREITKAADDHGVWTISIVPSALLALLCEPRSGAVLCDEHLAFMLAEGPARPTVLRRRRLSSDADRLPAALKGEELPEGFEVAYAAARLERGRPTIVIEGRAAKSSRRRWAYCRWTTLAAALLTLLVAPIAWSHHRQEDAALELARLAPARAEVLMAEGRLQEIVSGLETLSALQSRPTMVSVLAELASRLPRDATLMQFHADSAGLRLTVLAVSTSEVLQALEALPGYRPAEISGPIDPMDIEGLRLERAVLTLADIDLEVR
jgi:hypothetical protein